jgi:bleomycin hydrolase
MFWPCLLALVLALTACHRQRAVGEKKEFATEVLNGYTPVKQQGRSSTCWAYAMLAAIETEHIMRGDSVNLSVAYAVRHLLKDNYERYYLSGGRMPFSTRGMGQTLLNLIERHGLVAYDAYRGNEEANIGVLANKVEMLAQRAVARRAGIERYQPQVDAVLDAALGPLPRIVSMYGMMYTPGEFARSVCAPGEYIALTSFAHLPYGEECVLEVPDNWERNRLLNVPADTLMARIEQAVRSGHGVCWEGDISEPGFSFAAGTAVLEDRPYDRQRDFERFLTTDDHAMAIVGIARDRGGQRYYIMKNSWGTANPYGGLMYLSFDYVRIKTVAVYMTREAYAGR